MCNPIKIGLACTETILILFILAGCDWGDGEAKLRNEHYQRLADGRPPLTVTEVRKEMKKDPDLNVTVADFEGVLKSKMGGSMTQETVEKIKRNGKLEWGHRWDLAKFEDNFKSFQIWIYYWNTPKEVYRRVSGFPP